MQFLTSAECETWLRDRGRSKPCSENSYQTERFRFPKELGRLYWFARQIAATMMQSREECLLWMEEWSIWDENLHLYYRLRQSYGDHRLLAEAPGHLFLEYEAEDLATFLQVSILNGWGGTIATHLGYVNAFFSHDEFIDVFSSAEQNAHELHSLLITELLPPASA